MQRRPWRCITLTSATVAVTTACGRPSPEDGGAARGTHATGATPASATAPSASSTASDAGAGLAAVDASAPSATGMATELACGEGSCCVVDSSGAIFCWGGRRGLPAPVRGVPDPVGLTVSREHACARVRDGHLWCWGSNRSGELGDGGTTDRETPAPVPGLADVTSCSASPGFTCAVAAGALYCWGRNDLGEIGDGSRRARHELLRIAEHAVGVRTARMHGCAVLADETVTCWGYSHHGQTGVLHGDPSESDLGVHAVSQLGKVTSLSLDQLTTVAVNKAGSVVSMGKMSSCLGGAETTTPVALPGLRDVVAIAETCALTRAGDVRCWAFDLPGAKLPRCPPGRVLALPPVAQIAAGHGFVCARTTAGEVWCWGDASQGGLGQPTHPLAPPSPPVRVVW